MTATTLDPGALAASMARSPVVTFQAVTGYTCDPWQARELARICRGVPLHRIPDLARLADGSLTGTWPDGTPLGGASVHNGWVFQRQTITVTCRRAGKSERLLGVLINSAVNHGGSRSLIVSPTFRTSCLLLRRARRHLARFIAANPGLGLELLNNAATSVELRVGVGGPVSTIVALPGGSPDLIRGDGVLPGEDGRGGALVVDEVAFCSDALLTSAAAMLATVPSAAFDVASTAGGRVGWAFSTWHGDDVDWARVQTKASDNPRISPDELARLRRTLGPAQAAVELDSEWREAGTSVWTSEELDAMFPQTVKGAPERLPGEPELPGPSPYDARLWTPGSYIPTAPSPAAHADAIPCELCAGDGVLLGCEHDDDCDRDECLVPCPSCSAPEPAAPRRRVVTSGRLPDLPENVADPEEWGALTRRQAPARAAVPAASVLIPGGGVTTQPGSPAGWRLTSGTLPVFTTPGDPADDY